MASGGHRNAPGVRFRPLLNANHRASVPTPLGRGAMRYAGRVFGSTTQSWLANRLAFADLLRGLAALAVVIGHYSILYLTEPHIISAVTLGEPTRAVPSPRSSVGSTFPPSASRSSS